MGNILHRGASVPQQNEHHNQIMFINSIQINEFTCEICFEPVLNKFYRCSHHIFCTDCITSYIQFKLRDHNIGHIRCPGPSCHVHFLDPFDWAPLVSPELFVRWCDVLCQAAVIDSDSTCYCPYRDCNEVILNECGGTPKKSMCPSCKHWLCFQCKRVWHAQSGCEEGWELYVDQDDVETGLLVDQRKWMRCPRCKYIVESTGGCTVISCRCGIDFCYKCGQQRSASEFHRCYDCVIVTIYCLVFLFGLIMCFLIYTASTLYWQHKWPWEAELMI